MFGDRLKAIREYLQLNQKDFAIKLSISQQVLSNYEKGQRDVPNNILLMLPQFDVNPIWLLTGNGEMFLTEAEPQKQEEPAVSPETIRKFTNLLEEEFQKRFAEYQAPKDSTLIVKRADYPGRHKNSHLKDKEDAAIGNIFNIKRISTDTAKEIPLYGSKICAGNGLDADSDIAAMIDVNRDLFGGHKDNLYFVQVTGDSLMYKGIYDNDFIAVQTDRTPKLNDLVIARLPNGEFTVKFYVQDKEGLWLAPANNHYYWIQINDCIELIGVVTGVFRSSPKWNPEDFKRFEQHQ